MGAAKTLSEGFCAARIQDASTQAGLSGSKSCSGSVIFFWSLALVNKGIPSHQLKE